MYISSTFTYKDQFKAALYASSILPLIGFAFCPFVNAIVNGTETTISEYPYMAGVLTGSIFGDSLLCGEVVIGQRTVLTVAQCISSDRPEILKVRVGSADYTKGGTVAQVTNIKKRPNWNTNTLNANYAILHLLDDVVGLHDGLVTTALLPETDPAETSGLCPIRTVHFGDPFRFQCLM